MPSFLVDLRHVALLAVTNITTVKSLKKGGMTRIFQRLFWGEDDTRPLLTLR
jgi:hypothetical protein